LLVYVQAHLFSLTVFFLFNVTAPTEIYTLSLHDALPISDVAMIAHEIRNPLTLISSSLQVIEAQHPEVKEFYNWEQTMDDVKFMCSLMDELSTFNNSSSLHHSVFRIEQLLKNVAVSFAIALDAEHSEIDFSSRISPNMGEFTGDKIKLEQVILNLLRNAKDAVGS